MPASRLFDDMKVLSVPMEGKYPAKVIARQEQNTEVIHGFGEASRRGLGSTAQTGKDGKTNVCIGVWSTNEEEECSSNWKEFGNVVDDLEKEGREGRLDKLIVFFMTDSSTV